MTLVERATQLKKDFLIFRERQMGPRTSPVSGKVEAHGMPANLPIPPSGPLHQDVSTSTPPPIYVFDPSRGIIVITNSC